MGTLGKCLDPDKMPLIATEYGIPSGSAIFAMIKQSGTEILLICFGNSRNGYSTIPSLLYWT